MAENKDSLVNRLQQEAIKAYRTEYEKFQAELSLCNVLVIGKTGVGKSTLVNAVFREDLAQTGSGIPITQNLTRHAQPDCPITVTDTQGLEIDLSNQVGVGAIQKVKQEVANYIEARINNQKEQVHLVWYCVNSLSDRLEKIEEDWLQEIANKNVPIVLVLTKAFQDNSPFINNLKSRNLPVHDIIPVLATPYPVDINLDGNPVKYSIPVRGLDRLVEVAANILAQETKEVRQAFIQQQIANLEIKEKEALKYVAKYASLAALAAGISGAVAPGSAEVAILPTIQANMLANITSIFGLPISETFINTVFSIILGTAAGAAQTALTSWAANLFIPAVGSVVSGSVAAVSSSAATWGLGTVYVNTLKEYIKNQANKQAISEEDLKSIFIKQYNDYVAGKLTS